MVKSLIIPSGLSAVIFIDQFLVGKSKTIVGPAKIDLQSNPEYQEWNTYISSMYVLKSQKTKIRCKWVRVSTGYGDTMTPMMNGWESSNDQDTSDNLVDTFTEAASQGYEYVTPKGKVILS